ncbi:MAG: hypothetical protein KAG97_02200, partial [Victivallales bacterium]|nr:hypothetical protein [Victivallales bacterium]
KDFTTITRQRRLDPLCCDDQTLREIALELLRKEGLHSPVRLIGFGVSGLRETAEAPQLDLFQTLEKLETLYVKDEVLSADERRFFKAEEVRLVVADIPAIPLLSAQRARIPNIAIGNFSWDWIYEAYAKADFHWEFFVEKFRTVYELTDLLLRLPFAPPMEVFPNRKDIPLLASPGSSCREKIVDMSYNDISTDKPWILLSFTSLELEFQALENIRALSHEYEFFCVEPLHYKGSCIHSISRNTASFADILASCDIVISKPGFGLVSECIVNNKPLIYSDRGDFAEYPYLVEGIEKYLRNTHLPSEQLYAGDFFQALEEIKTAPESIETIESGGAEMIAEELLRTLE